MQLRNPHGPNQEIFVLEKKTRSILWVGHTLRIPMHSMGVVLALHSRILLSSLPLARMEPSSFNTRQLMPRSCSASIYKRTKKVKPDPVMSQ